MEGSASNALFNIGPLEVNSVTTTTWGIMLVLIVLAILVRRHITEVPGKLQNGAEAIIENLQGFFSDVMGPIKTKKYLPLLATLFVFILVSNYSGLLPQAGSLPGLSAPTSSLSVTAALAIVVFFSTHILGFKTQGGKYLKHFVQPVAFMLPLLILEEFVRPLSLSLRLFGNIFGEETVAHELFGIFPVAALPMMFLAILFGFIQALVFTMLTAIYIDGATAE